VVRQPAGGADPAPGSQVDVTAEPAHLHLFDPASGERLR
jgi:hypothetical protein